MRARLAGVALVVIVSVLFYAQYRRNKLAADHPAPGILADAGGVRLHIHCEGTGSPVVLLEAGMNDFSVHWAEVQRGIARTNRVCAYDRAGLGWSEQSAYPRSLSQITSELHGLLRSAGIADADLILAGHSYGGLIVKAYAARYPERIRGLVLVDSAHEMQLARLPFLAGPFKDAAGQFRKLAWLSSAGFLALSVDQIPDRGLSPEDAARYRAVLAGTDYFNAAAKETESAFEAFTLKEVRPASRQLPAGMPLIVIARGKPDPIPGLNEEQRRQYEEEWQRMQKDLLSLSSDAQFIVASQSGHYVQLSQPEIVIRAAASLARGLRAKRS